MKNIIVNGKITATSSKVKKGMSTETKTAFVKVDEETAKKLQDFGLTKYTSEQEKEDFFVIKLVKNLAVYKVGLDDPIKMSELSSLETPNFNTPKTVSLNIIKTMSEEFNKEFYRIQAILVENLQDIEEVIPENPFKNL